MNAFDGTTWWIRGGRVVDPASGVDRMCDIRIERGHIAHISPGTDHVGSRPFAYDKPAAAQVGEETPVIDARGLLIVPGLVDMHVHLREPGGEHKETLRSGTDAAAAGGFTAVAAMGNTKPVPDDVEVVRWILDRSTGMKARVYPIASVTKEQEGQEIVPMADLMEAGAVAFSDDGRSIEDEAIMREALRRAAQVDALIIPHAECRVITEGALIHAGGVAAEWGLKGMPPEAEEQMIARDLRLVEETGARLHIAHVSTAGAVALIREAKQRGLPVSCEATPHHAALTQEAVRTCGANAKMNPPLRDEQDVQAVREGLADGTIDVIASDHAPHAPEEKALGLEKAPFGIIGLETTLGLILTELVGSGILDLPGAIAKMTCAPAELLRIPGGRLSVGAPADLTLIDLHRTWRVNISDFKSRSRNSPFQGWTLTGKASATLVGGKWYRT